MDSSRILDRLHQIIEAAKLLNSTLDPAEVTRILLRIVKEDLGVDRGTVFVLDREAACLRSIVALELDTEIVVPVGMGIAGTVAATGEIIDIPDAYNDSRFAPSFDAMHKYQTRDIYCAPITNRQGVIVGVFQLLNRQFPLTPEDREFLSGIAVHVGLALENAWFHQQLLEKQRIEEQLAVAERQMFHMEKLSLLGELVAGVTHELRNPLSTVSGYCALLKEQPDIPAHVMPYLDKIEASAKRANAIVEKFLGFSRKKKFEKKPLVVDDMIRQTIDLRTYEWRGKHIRIVAELSSPPAILGDMGQLQQVLMNLFKNAEDVLGHSQDGGTVTIRTSLNARDKSVRIEVSDDGPGIPDDVQARLFEPFFTTKEDTGTGLGLSICRRIVDQHGGKIWFETAMGKGTTFIIELPQLLEAPGAGQTAPSIRVLVVDADRQTYSALGEAMLAMGHELTTASSVNEALRELRNKKFDLVIFDLNVPHLGGIEFYKEAVMMHLHPSDRFALMRERTHPVEDDFSIDSIRVPVIHKPLMAGNIRSILGR